MFQLIHLSDVHLAPFDPPRVWQLLNKRITGWLNWQLNRHQLLGEGVLSLMCDDWQKQRQAHAPGAGHVVISGDLVNLALPDEFVQARQWLERLGDPKDVSLVLGNHDAYVPGALGRACEIFSPWMRGEASASRFMMRRTKLDDMFPYCRIRGCVALIGVNSALATMPFSARGMFGKKQAHHLRRLLQETSAQKLFRVVFMHHPPLHHATSCFKALKGIERFQRIIATQGAELILHGHTHQPTLNFIDGRGGQVPVVGVSSISQSFAGHKPAANYNIFQIKRREAGWQCLLIRRGLVNAHHEIAETLRQELYPPR